MTPRDTSTPASLPLTHLQRSRGVQAARPPAAPRREPQEQRAKAREVDRLVLREALLAVRLEDVEHARAREPQAPTARDVEHVRRVEAAAEGQARAVHGGERADELAEEGPHRRLVDARLARPRRVEEALLGRARIGEVVVRKEERAAVRLGGAERDHAGVGSAAPRCDRRLEELRRRADALDAPECVGHRVVARDDLVDGGHVAIRSGHGDRRVALLRVERPHARVARRNLEHARVHRRERHERQLGVAREVLVEFLRDEARQPCPSTDACGGG